MEAKTKSDRDVHQIHQYEHNEGLNARRVYVVGGGLSVDPEIVSEGLKKALESVKFDMNTGNQEIRVIEVPTQVFVPQIETKTIEIPVPVVTKEVEIVEIERPIITERLKIETIEKPVLIEKIKIETVEKPVLIEKTKILTPAWAWGIITCQTLAIGGLIWSILTKKWGI